VGWPKFRSWGQQWFSLLYDEPHKGFKLAGNLLTLSCGVDEQGKRIYARCLLTDLRALRKAQIRTLRIVKEGGRFYAVFSVLKWVVQPKPLTAESRVIALDANHKNFVYGVDSEGHAIEVESPHWIKKLDQRLDELTALRDRCQRRSIWVGQYDDQGRPTGKGYWRPSCRWQKLNQRIQRLLAKRRIQTQIFLRQLANRLCATYDQIGIGDYIPRPSLARPRGRRAMCNQSLIGRFKETMAWTAKRSGKHFKIYNERGTTRTCHQCGHVVQGGLLPSIRCWQCPGCGVHHHRDENAAQNGLRRLEPLELPTSHTVETDTTVQSPRPNVTITHRARWRVRPVGILVSEPDLLEGCRCLSEKKAS